MQIFLFIGLLASFVIGAPTYTNPVVPNVNLPDPGAILVDGLFVMVATSMGESDHFPIYTSTDLSNWKFHSFVWPESSPLKPKWAITDYWAPEIHLINQKFSLYYTARDTKGRLCIGVATSNGTVFGPYSDSGKCLVRDPNVGFIDATVTRDVISKDLYLIWKEDDNDVGIEKCHIWLQKMAPSGLDMDPSSPRTLLIINDAPWEGPIVEAPWIVFHEGYYYMFYSANACWNSSYAVGAARARSLAGPWVKDPANPILHDNKVFAGPGHCSVLQTHESPPRWVMLYHSWKVPEIGWAYKRLFLQDEVKWDTLSGWPYIDTDSPSIGPRPVP